MNFAYCSILNLYISYGLLLIFALFHLSAYSENINQLLLTTENKSVLNRLTVLQSQMDSVRQNVSDANTDEQLQALNDAAVKISNDADALDQDIRPTWERIRTQLEILGPAPAPAPAPVNGNNNTEKYNIMSEQRKFLENRGIVYPEYLNISVSYVEMLNIFRQKYLRYEVVACVPDLLKIPVQFLAQYSGNRYSIRI